MYVSLANAEDLCFAPGVPIPLSKSVFIFPPGARRIVGCRRSWDTHSPNTIPPQLLCGPKYRTSTCHFSLQLATETETATGNWQLATGGAEGKGLHNRMDGAASRMADAKNASYQMPLPPRLLNRSLTLASSHFASPHFVTSSAVFKID